MYKILSSDFDFNDNRGHLTQLVHQGYQQVNVITSKAGVVRGDHFHKNCREAFYVILGSVDVALQKEGDEQQLHFREHSFFEIEPFTIHRMFFPEDCIMVALYDVPVEMENGEKDIWPA